MTKEKVTAFAARAEPFAYAALRIVAGAMFALHGVQKIFDWPTPGHSQPIASQLGIGGLIELGCGVLIALGLFARPAAFLASGTMAVAYFQFHWKLSFAQLQWLPSINQGELAALYCFVFLVIATRGAGIASLDKRSGL